MNTLTIARSNVLNNPVRTSRTKESLSSFQSDLKGFLAPISLTTNLDAEEAEEAQADLQETYNVVLKDAGICPGLYRMKKKQLI